MTNVFFALNHDKNLQFYFVCVKRQAKNDFLKDVKSTVGVNSFTVISPFVILEKLLWHQYIPS